MNFLRDPRVQLIGALLLAAVLTVYLVRRVLRRATARLHRLAPTEDQHLAAELLRSAIGPLSFLTWYYALYVAARVILLSDWVRTDVSWADATLRHCASLGVFIGFLWFFYQATVVIDVRLRRIAKRTTGKLDDVLLPLLGTALRVTIPIFAVFVLLRLWPISEAAMAVTRKLLAIALIAAITWTLRRAVLLVDEAVLGTEAIGGSATLTQRALYTRVRMLRRVALVIIGLFAFAAVLMMFDEVRDLGRSILASAGIAGIVLGIAAQRSLGNLLAGIQIAVTQPIRLGDQVLVEGDVGNIEEITLTYVVVRVWDQRRIVLPISYFIEKPFQNWTRVSTNMLSPLTMRFDFSLPIDELRTYLQHEIAQSKFWDKQVFGVQVTNADDRSMEVRVLASAPDSGASFNLQCELREKALTFVQRRYPECLPRIRQEQHRVEPATAETDRADHPLAQTARDREPAARPNPVP
jgi:small-conductance mechanosensitive channel